MTASPDRAERLKQRLIHMVDDHRATINRATDIQATLRIDGKKIVQPWFDDITDAEAPDALSALDEIERDIIQAIAEADGALTVERLEEKCGHNRSTFYGTAGRLRRLVTEGILLNVRGQGYKLTPFGLDLAAQL